VPKEKPICGTPVVIPSFRAGQSHEDMMEEAVKGVLEETKLLREGTGGESGSEWSEVEVREPLVIEEIVLSAEEIVTESPLMANVPKDIVEDIVRQSTFRKYDQGETFLYTDDVMSTVFIIGIGSVALVSTATMVSQVSVCVCVYVCH